MSVESCVLISVVLSSCAVKLSEGYESKSCKTSLLLFAISTSYLAEHPTYSFFFFFFFFFFAVYNVQWLSSHFKRTKNRDLSFLRKSLCTRKLSSRVHGINFRTFVLIFFYYFYFYFNRLSWSFIVTSYVLEVELQV